MLVFFHIFSSSIHRMAPIAVYRYVHPKGFVNNERKTKIAWQFYYCKWKWKWMRSGERVSSAFKLRASESNVRVKHYYRINILFYFCWAHRKWPLWMRLKGNAFQMHEFLSIDLRRTHFVAPFVLFVWWMFYSPNGNWKSSEKRNPKKISLTQNQLNFPKWKSKKKKKNFFVWFHRLQTTAIFLGADQIFQLRCSNPSECSVNIMNFGHSQKVTVDALNLFLSLSLSHFDFVFCRGRNILLYD